MPYSPLGRGFLTGHFQSPDDIEEGDSRRERFPRFEREHFDKNMELAERVRQIAEEKGVTAGQLALAWLLHQGDDIVPIPGTKRIKYLEENAGGAEVKLGADELQRIDQAAPAGAASGDRYADMSTVNR